MQQQNKNYFIRIKTKEERLGRFIRSVIFILNSDISDGSARKMTKRKSKQNMKKPFQATWDVEDLFENL